MAEMVARKLDGSRDACSHLVRSIRAERSPANGGGSSTAQFLHFGPVHLVANVGALLLLGGFVERRLGTLRYLVVYFAAGSLALGGFVAVVALGLRPHAVLLGASANVMGIVGATAAILFRGLWADGARVAARPLLTIVLIVLGQAVLDLTVTGLSFIGHALGAVSGFVVAGLLLAAQNPHPGARLRQRADRELAARELERQAHPAAHCTCRPLTAPYTGARFRTK